MSRGTDAATARRALVVACAATAITLVDVTVVYLALPDLTADLGASFAELSWVVDAYAVAVASTLLLCGALADRHGRVRTFLAGLAVFGLGSAACAAAPTALVLDLARALQGLGAAALLATSLALIAAHHEGAARARALGVWGAVSGAALAAGPVVGGVVLDLAGWRWVFALNVPVVLVVAAVTLRGRLPGSRDPAAGEARPDVAGAVLASGALALLVAGLLHGPTHGWDDAVTRGALLAAAALGLAFVAVERRSAAPLLPPRLLARREVGPTVAVAFLQSVAIYPVLLYLAVELQVVHGFSPLAAGVRVLPITVTLLAAAVVTGRATARVGHRPPVVVGLLGTAAGLLLLRGTSPDDPWTALLPGFLVMGAGMGALSPGLADAIMAMLPGSRAALASGLGNTARQVGIAAGVAILAAVFAAATPAGDPASLLAREDGAPRAPARAAAAAFLDGVDAVLLVAALFALAGAAAALALPGRARAAVPSGTSP